MGSGTNCDSNATILGFGSHTENYKGESVTFMDQVSFGNAQQAAAGTYTEVF